MLLGKKKNTMPKEENESLIKYELYLLKGDTEEAI